MVIFTVFFDTKMHTSVSKTVQQFIFTRNYCLFVYYQRRIETRNQKLFQGKETDFQFSQKKLRPANKKSYTFLREKPHFYSKGTISGFEFQRGKTRRVPNQNPQIINSRRAPSNDLAPEINRNRTNQKQKNLIHAPKFQTTTEREEKRLTTMSKRRCDQA